MKRSSHVALLLMGVTGVGADPQAVLAGAQSTLREVHGIEHATLQVEVTPARECREATW